MTNLNETDKSTASLSEKEGEDLFYKAFSELSGEEYKPSEFRSEDPVKSEEDTPQPEEVVAAPENTEEKKEEPAPEQAVENKAPSTPDDFIQSFPEDKREIVQQLLAERNLSEQRYRSHQGRLAAERKARLAAEEALSKLRTKGASSPQDKIVAEQAKADYKKSIAEWQQVVEAEPTLAKAVDALTDAKVKDVESRFRAELEQAESLRSRHAAEDTKAREWELLVEQVPNAGDVISSPVFHYWKDNIAPPSLRDIAENSIDHRDALFVLQQFTPYAMWVHEQQNGRQAPQTQTPPAPSTVADKISEDRSNKVGAVINSPAPKPNLAADPGNEFGDDVAERLFAEAYAKIKNR